MEIQKVTAAYFSPTGGTKAYAEGLASAWGPDFGKINLTVPAERAKKRDFGPDELVILGAPVYAGRLPSVEGGLFRALRGQGTPAVCLVSYGNRAYDDALLELMDLCTAQGFRCIAASAWIAPHTFSGKIGAGRPDASDREKLGIFAEEVQALLRKEIPEGSVPPVPGHRPYCPEKKMPFHPEADSRCIRCGRCVSACPVGAIDPASPDQTDAARCIDCLACVHACPVHARSIYHPSLADIGAGCEAAFLTPRREPEWFLAGQGEK